MPINPQMQRKIVVVHGVQTGDDDDLNQDELIRKLFQRRLAAGSGLVFCLLLC